jgi:NurA domain
MLDLTKLAQQMQGISQYLAVEATATRQRLELARSLLAKAAQHQPQLMADQQAWGDRLCFTAAAPAEPLHLRLGIAAAPAAHTVLSTDGSQIAPNHHEIAYCYLINVGRIVLHYGQNRLPLLDSLPEVFYRPEDLYVSRQWGIRTEEWMGYQRTVSEARMLADLGEGIRDAGMGRLAASPALAMVDGSLIYWFLDALPQAARDRILPPILEAWERLRARRIPLVGYVSASRSGEALNFLRLQACPFATPDCGTHCAGKEGSGKEGAGKDRAGSKSDRPPCQVLDPLKDTAVWNLELEPGQRSPLWRSSARILDLYGDQEIYFCYVHVGTEVARVEFPAWVAQDPDLLETALSLTIAQVQKGFGYPVALAEAHNQAVVRGGDRTRFFALLEQQMIRAGLRNVGTSYKEARKRGSIA